MNLWKWRDPFSTFVYLNHLKEVRVYTRKPVPHSESLKDSTQYECKVYSMPGIGPDAEDKDGWNATVLKEGPAYWDRVNK